VLRWLRTRSASAFVLWACALGGTVLAAAAALAQSEAPPASEGAHALTPPAVFQAVEAVYPPEALAQRLEAEVELMVTIASDGAVLDVEVTRPAGHGFDEAAREALRTFRFHPARNKGEPVAARIRYLYKFSLPAAPPPPPPTQGKLKGRILTERGRFGIAAADITLIDLATRQWRTLQTDAEGGFELMLAPGRYRVRAVANGYLPANFDEQVSLGEETQVAYRLFVDPVAGPSGEPAYGAQAVIEAPPREVTRRSLERDLMYKIPGTSNDPIRSVEVLPGVARPPFGNGLTYTLPRSIDLGAAFRYYTGNPFTPVIGRAFNASERDYVSLFGPVNSARNPAYMRLDVRIQKTWKASRHTTTLYLDVQNATNRKNQEAFFYNYDQTRRSVVNGLPIIPAIGVRGQF
jgi:TonB family protein